MTVAVVDDLKKRCSFEEALEFTGFGKYNIVLLLTCCLLILGMYVDIFGFSLLMPPVACDLELSAAQQGFLSAVPLIGVMVSSYPWGLCADTLGRRKTLLLAMPLGVFFSFLASLAPNYWSLAVLKFLSCSLTSSANAAAFVLLGESVVQRTRSRFMFLMATTTMLSQLVICLFAIPIYRMSFRISVPWLALDYRPWRLLMQVICLPGALGCLICIFFVKESPKFLLCKGREDEFMDVIKTIYSHNTGMKKDTFPVGQVFLEDEVATSSSDNSFLRKMWNQTVPLFKPPLLMNSIKLYYLLLCAYMTSTGFTMWFPSIINAYFNGDNTSGQRFCEVASKSAGTKNSTVTDCDNTIESMTIYATMCYSALPGVLTILLSFVVGPLGKKKTMHLIFIVSLVCGIPLFFVTIPVLSIGLFCMYLYVSLILGNANAYLIELNPTHLRGMATCLSVVVARGFGFISVQVIAALIGDYCTPMLSGYMLLVACLVVSFFLPADTKKVTDFAAIEKPQIPELSETSREFKQ